MVAVSKSSRSTARSKPSPSRVRQQSYGSRGNHVRRTQKRLNASGAKLAQDGIFGPRTQAAVRQFQSKNGLKVDGIVGPQTRAALRAYDGGGSGALRPGMENQATNYLQRALNVRGHTLDVDGKYGPRTTEAVRAFQREHGLNPDGVFGPQTFEAMRRTNGGASPDGPTPTTTGTSGVNDPNAQPGQPANRTATFDRVYKKGQRSQMMEGRVTVNGRTYNFRSGGGGRGNLPPGDYKITPHLWNRSDRSMSVGGVGYSFAMSNKYDPRVGGTRTLLRIHPDGGSKGTIGCMGIIGNAAVQRQFREDMRAELARNGGSFTLRVGR